MRVSFICLLSTVVTIIILQHVSFAQQPNIIFFLMDDVEFISSWEDAAPDGYTLSRQPTPFIDEFMSESVVFTRAYCAAPKCAPSRFAVLTGRYASRSEFAEARTIGTGITGLTAKVTVPYAKIYYGDLEHNVPNALRTYSDYYTGMTGKWHLNADDNGLGCDTLNSVADEELYLSCLEVCKEQGWDWADAIYEGNILGRGALEYSHNPEWMVSQAQKFIDLALDVEDKPFFLHFATTLAHTPDTEEALRNFTYLETPKGVLTGDDIPDDTTMPSRDMILRRAQGWDDQMPGMEENTVDYVWLDSTLEALVHYLKERGIYDNTFIVLMNDHGMEAKSSLYEAGTRMLMMVRYPPLFGTDGPHVMPPSMIVSNVDLAATVFALTETEPGDDYELDGVSWLDEVVSVIETGTYESDCCDLRYMDMVYSHAIVSDEYQFIYRMTTETDGDYSDMFPSFYETEQLYNVIEDPTQQVNLVDEWDYEEKLWEMEILMYYYITDICPFDECDVSMRFQVQDFDSIDSIDSIETTDF